ncbi:MAG: hypothetical protein ACT4PL_07520, partial [Phycisphaerales bacterium]
MSFLPKRRLTLAAITLVGVVCGTAQSNPPHGHDTPTKPAAAPAKPMAPKPVAKTETAPSAKPIPAPTQPKD